MRVWSSKLPRRVCAHNKWGVVVASYDKTNKGSKGDISGKVMPLPVINRVKFYREHLFRSIEAVRILWQEYVAVQDAIYAELIEFENSIIELQDEIARIERLYGEDKIDR